MKVSELIERLKEKHLDYEVRIQIEMEEYNHISDSFKEIKIIEYQDIRMVGLTAILRTGEL